MSALLVRVPLLLSPFLNPNRVLKGTALLTPDLRNAARALLHHETPPAWLKMWDGPEDPLVWLRFLVSKSLALSSWMERAKHQKLLQKPLDLADLFRADVFLNALRQQTAQQTQQSIDSLKFVCAWQPGALDSAALSCRLTGLYLQGCLFDGRRLSPTERTSSSICEVPECTVAWLPASAPDPLGDGKLSFPLYDNEAREKVVARLMVPCSRADHDTWIRTAAAFFLKVK